jgi:hypothetical protein
MPRGAFFVSYEVLLPHKNIFVSRSDLFAVMLPRDRRRFWIKRNGTAKAPDCYDLNCRKKQGIRPGGIKESAMQTSLPAGCKADADRNAM